MTDETNKPKFSFDSIPIGTTKTVQFIQEYPTQHLRFVLRDDRSILQQLWVKRTWADSKEDWRDVPMVTEE